jgi:hypothetical protein
MFGYLNIRRSAQSVHEVLRDRCIFSTRVKRHLRDRFLSLLFAEDRFLNRRPNSSVFSAGHRFPDLAGDDLGLRADYHLQNIATGTDNAARAQGPERGLVDQGVIRHLEPQPRRAGVYEFKIPVTT